MSDEKQHPWHQGVHGMFWAHTVYGGDDYDSMGFCDLDDPKVQTVGVNVKMPDGPVNFYMNMDRLGRVDPQEGQRVFDLNVQAARLFVAAPELLAAMEEATAIADKWWDENGSYCDCIDAMQQTLRSAIAKAKGGE